MEIDFEDMIQRADQGGEAERVQKRGTIKATDGVIPIFHQREIADEPASAREGRPIYRVEDWIEIICPGSRDRVLRPVLKKDKERFAEQWESYKRGDHHQVTDGTPITQWQGVSRQRAAELRASGIYTVEQLADATDNTLQRLGMDARKLQEAARKFVAGTAEATAERKRREEVEGMMRDQNRIIEQLEARLAELEGVKHGADDPTDRAERRPKHRD